MKFEEKTTEFAIIHLLDRIKGLGPIKFRQIYEAYKSFSAFWEMTNKTGYEFTVSSLRFDVKFQRTLVEQLKTLNGKLEESRKFMIEQMDKAEELDGKLISYFDKEYPPNLYRTNQCVPIIYAVGKLDILMNEKCCAVVGTRKPSEWSKHETKVAVERLAKQDYVIVSGLAKGIDTIAHEIALARRAQTIAVVGCGVDVYYPKENWKLQDEIRQKGAIVSEYAFGSKVQPISLQKRDKIIVGLSKYVLITETSTHGGTMNAYRACLEQRKPVGVFIPPPNVLGGFDGNIEIANQKKTKTYRFLDGASVDFGRGKDA